MGRIPATHTGMYVGTRTAALYTPLSSLVADETKVFTKVQDVSPSSQKCLLLVNAVDLTFRGGTEVNSRSRGLD